MPAENPSGQGRSDDARHGNCGHEDRSGFGAVLVAKPMGEIDNDTGKEARLRDPEQKSRQIKLARRVYRRHQDGNEPPGHQDSRDPLASAPPFHDQGSRYFKEKVANRENAGAQAKDAIAEVQIARHLQARVTYVDAIQKRDYVENKKEWQQAAGDASRGTLSDIRQNSSGRHFGSAFVA